MRRNFHFFCFFTAAISGFVSSNRLLRKLYVVSSPSSMIFSVVVVFIRFIFDGVTSSSMLRLSMDEEIHLFIFPCDALNLNFFTKQQDISLFFSMRNPTASDIRYLSTHCSAKFNADSHSTVWLKISVTHFWCASAIVNNCFYVCTDRTIN